MDKTASIFRSVVRSRYSTKRFKPNEKIPKSIIDDVIDSTLTTPSGFNLQPTQVILVSNQKIKQQLSKEAMLGAGNMYRTNDASILAVFCADLEPTNQRLAKICQIEKESKMREPGYMATMPVASSFLIGPGKLAKFFKQITTDALSPLQPMPCVDSTDVWSYKNTSLMVQTYVLAATSHGLATCIMEGYDDRRLKQILNIPSDRYGVPMVVATGFEYEENPDLMKKSPRLNKRDVFFRDKFGQLIEE